MTDGATGSTPLLLVRLRSGPGVRETQRVVHLVPVAETDGTPPAVLTALCGFTTAPGIAEVLSGLGGMPCERCMSRTASPEGARLRAANLPAVGGAW